MIASILLILGAIFSMLVFKKQQQLTKEMTAYFASNRQVIEGLNLIIGKQHDVIQKLLGERLARDEKLNELAELALPGTHKNDHDASVVIMFQKLEDARKAVDKRLPPDSLIAKELKDILE